MTYHFNTVCISNISKCLQHTKVKVSCLRLCMEGQGARRKKKYYLESEENEVCFREADNEYKRLKEDFAQIARNQRTRNHSRSDSSKSPSPCRRQPPRRSTNLPKFKIATFYATDVELWFNQIETQFDLHQINDDMCSTFR